MKFHVVYLLIAGFIIPHRYSVFTHNITARNYETGCYMIFLLLLKRWLERLVEIPSKGIRNSNYDMQ